MTKEETLGMITLAIKNKNPKSILLKCNLLGYCRLHGKLLISGSFLYSINLKKSIISFDRLWNTLLSENSGNTDEEFLENLNRLIEKYHYPRYCLSQAYYKSPETNELKEYPMSDNEKEKWFNIDEEDL